MALHEIQDLKGFLPWEDAVEVAGENSYDLITMDIDMPGMSGHEVLNKIREWEEANNVYKQGGDVKILMAT